MNKEPTIKDVLDSMTQKQLVFLYHTLGCVLRGTVVLRSWVENEMDKLHYTKPMKDVTRFLMEIARKERKKIIAEEKKIQNKTGEK